MDTQTTNITGAAKSGGLLGFRERYNAVFYWIFAGALFAFSTSQLRKALYYDSVFCGQSGGTAFGDCYYYSHGWYKAGMFTHLACILPAGALAVFQFVPRLRRKAISLHRINGRVIVLLIFISTVGALMVVRRSFGGDISTQGGVGVLSIMTLYSVGMAIREVKRGRVMEHRAWMMRCWFYLGSIITDRVIMILAAFVITATNDYYAIRPCAQLAYVSELEARSYPACAAYFRGSDPDALAIIPATFNGNHSEKEAAIGVPFGMAIWLGLAIHAIGIEVYLNHEAKKSVRSQKAE